MRLYQNVMGRGLAGAIPELKSRDCFTNVRNDDALETADIETNMNDLVVIHNY